MLPFELLLAEPLQFFRVEVALEDINDHSPLFREELVRLKILERSDRGSHFRWRVAHDLDIGSNSRTGISGANGKISCALEDQLLFSLRPAYKNYYELVTTFTVDVSDVNDNAPVFNQTSYTMYVRENNVPTVFCGARRRPERPRCSCISVNSENGHVFVLRPLDYEHLRQTEVTVVASDAGSPPLRANVTVRLVVLDENDNAPLVLYPGQESGAASSELVPVSAEAGYLITKVVAVDADSGQKSWLSYHLLRATEPGLFTVAVQSGEGSSAATEEQDGSLTTYLIISLAFVSLLFLISAAVFVARKVCRRKELQAGHVLYGADNLQSGLADAAAAGTLPAAPTATRSALTTGSGNSEFKFLKPILPSLPPQHCATGQGPEEGQDFPWSLSAQRTWHQTILGLSLHDSSTLFPSTSRALHTQRLHG
ncbi:hypothetical protein DUI87_26979 [Hirundo rustica rustica]|uniref:Cadherin domain-containing protein n=1 Tax=Hirundo rustica rustica TaxID=333673 RepID=A0A3M0J7P5_HIRRU|nr:hypothetical protein DUI87_26979 [Hirundo rustica rustica]